eukprot:6211520-Amphidinium_carterae.1
MLRRPVSGQRGSPTCSGLCRGRGARSSESVAILAQGNPANLQLPSRPNRREVLGLLRLACGLWLSYFVGVLRCCARSDC